ncbi:hypothetical protein [Pseudomonas reinekei]|jgi:hypothetical protein|nr:hypothetical protein [Pseudomonas reinekei]
MPSQFLEARPRRPDQKHARRNAHSRVETGADLIFTCFAMDLALAGI